MAAVNLKFVRGVGQDAIVEAFNDAFKGLDADAVTAAVPSAVDSTHAHAFHTSH